MDEMVRQAMEKWPDVPAVFGWLALDRRGSWLIKDERITNPLMIDFINRNYGHDCAGRWFFQNGPQRVFVRLAYAPWVLRTGAGNTLITHTGQLVAKIDRAWLDDAGVVLFETEHGPATLDDRDIEVASSRFVDDGGRPPHEDELVRAVERIANGERVELYFEYAGRKTRVEPIARSDAPTRLGFISDPQPDQTNGVSA